MEIHNCRVQLRALGGRFSWSFTDGNGSIAPWFLDTCFLKHHKLTAGQVCRFFTSSKSFQSCLRVSHWLTHLVKLAAGSRIFFVGLAVTFRNAVLQDSEKMVLYKIIEVLRSLDERVGEEEHQGNHQTVNGQGLHEGQGQQQHTSQVICHLRLARDAINASAGGNALANTRTDRSQANGEASANGRQCRDPHGALISKCCLWCHQSGRGQSCCGSSACSRSRHMGAARGRHEGGQECTAAQQHGTSQDERASHLGTINETAIGKAADYFTLNQYRTLTIYVQYMFCCECTDDYSRSSVSILCPSFLFARPNHNSALRQSWFT